MEELLILGYFCRKNLTMQDNHAVKFGILAGLGTIIFLFLFYWIDKKLILSPEIIWSTMFLYLLGMYMAPVEERKENGGYIDFKPALRAAFIVWIVANSIYHLFNYVLYNFLDKEMLNVQQQYMRDNMGTVEGFVSPENYELLVANIEQMNYNFVTVFTAYISSLIWGFILAAIIGRMVRRKPISMGSGQ